MAIEKEGTSNKMDVDGELFPQIGTADIKPSVGYVYDILMMAHHNRSTDHDEKPGRITVIYDRLKQSGCLRLMKKIPCQPATQEDILTVHSADHWDKVMSYSCR
jgi:acetoin utilization deacetylase AcuC-like enzyme